MALIKPNAASSESLEARTGADMEKYQKKIEAPSLSDEYAYERIGASFKLRSNADKAGPNH